MAHARLNGHDTLCLSHRERQHRICPPPPAKSTLRRTFFNEQNPFWDLKCASPCEMPAGVGEFISFHFPHKRTISQVLTALISHCALGKYFAKPVLSEQICLYKRGSIFFYFIATRPIASAWALWFLHFLLNVSSMYGHWFSSIPINPAQIKTIHSVIWIICHPAFQKIANFLHGKGYSPAKMKEGNAANFISLKNINFFFL